MSDPFPAGLMDLIRIWRQGDCVPCRSDFLFQIDPSLPLTEEAREAVAVDPEGAYVVQPVEGLMVISQTCDIVKECSKFPFVEVAPIVTLASQEFKEAKLGARPRFVTVPGLYGASQAADLDRVLTVEKACLTRWPRLEGCTKDAERRNLGRLLARKRQRAALPDEFAPWFKPLRKRWAKWTESRSAEAAVFEDLQEIRVQASPSWAAESIRLFLWFILKDDASVVDRSEVLADWMGRLTPTPPFTTVDARIVRYADIQASDYIDSDLLELDQFSPEDEDG